MNLNLDKLVVPVTQYVDGAKPLVPVQLEWPELDRLNILYQRSASSYQMREQVELSTGTRIQEVLGAPPTSFVSDGVRQYAPDSLSPQKQYLLFKTATELGVWDVKSSTVLYTWNYDPSQPFARVYWSPDETKVIWQDSQGIVHMRELPTGAHFQFTLRLKSEIGHVTGWSPDSACLTVTSDHYSGLLDIASSTFVMLWDHPLSQVIWNDNCAFVAFSDGHHNRLYDLRKGIAFDFIGQDLFFHPGNRALTYRGTDTIVLFELDTWQSQEIPTWQQKPAWFTYAPDLRHLLVGLEQGMLLQDNLLGPTLYAGGAVGSLHVWSPDGRHIAVEVNGKRDGVVKVYDTKLVQQATYIFMRDQVKAMAWSPDSQYIAIAGGREITVRQIP